MSSKKFCDLRSYQPREEWMPIKALVKLHSCTWVINDYKYDDSPPSFTCEKRFEIPNAGLAWTIVFEPPTQGSFGKLSLTQGRPGLYIVNPASPYMFGGTSRPTSAVVQYRAYILSARQEKFDTQNSHHEPMFTICDTISPIVWDEFVSFEDLRDQSKRLIDNNNTLTIVCEARVFEGIDLNVVNKSRSERVESLECRLLPNSIPHEHDVMADIKALYNDEETSDVTVDVDGRKFVVHKTVLIGRSTVFRAMFDSKMKEQESGVITIKDMTADVVESMLCFMYTDEVPNIETLAEELLAAAEQYDIPRLKAECERQLTKTLDINNATAILTFSNLHKAHRLQSASVKFIARHFDEVIETDGWKSLNEEFNAMIFAELADVLKQYKLNKMRC